MLDAGSVKALPLPPCALGFRTEMSPQVEMVGLRGLKFLSSPRELLWGRKEHGAYLLPVAGISSTVGWKCCGVNHSCGS